MSKGNVIVVHDSLGTEVIAVSHHQPARQYAYASLEHAHVDVELKHVYILALEKCCGESHNGRVIGAQEFFHPQQM